MPGVTISIVAERQPGDRKNLEDYVAVTLSQLMKTYKLYSPGVLLDIDDLSKWKLGDYYAVNAYTPSRHKLYTVLNLFQVFFFY